MQELRQRRGSAVTDDQDTVTFAGYEFVATGNGVELTCTRCILTPSWYFHAMPTPLFKIVETVREHNDQCPNRSHTLFAPFTPEQVERLNRYQVEASMHPFTCANRDSHSEGAVLTATVDGWVCGECDYTQTWAHRFMAEWGA